MPEEEEDWRGIGAMESRRHRVSHSALNRFLTPPRKPSSFQTKFPAIVQIIIAVQRPIRQPQSFLNLAFAAVA